MIEFHTSQWVVHPFKTAPTLSNGSPFTACMESLYIGLCIPPTFHSLVDVWTGLGVGEVNAVTHDSILPFFSYMSWNHTQTVHVISEYMQGEIITFKTNSKGDRNIIALKGEMCLGHCSCTISKLHEGCDSATIDHIHCINHVLTVEMQPLPCVVV